MNFLSTPYVNFCKPTKSVTSCVIGHKVYKMHLFADFVISNVKKLIIRMANKILNYAKENYYIII